jgi:hypothetical protein
MAKKTPKDATALEREQLRFLLSQGDVASTLSDLNPSIAWLPVLAEMELIDANTQLASWIGKNFADVDAVREVAANIHFFNANTAEVLEVRLNQVEGVSPVLMECWRLIIRHMKSAKRGLALHEWFDLVPRIRRGERTIELLERIAEALRPKLKIGKRILWDDGSADEREPERATDILEIDFEVDSGVSASEFLSVWPDAEPQASDEKLLSLLSQELVGALGDAIDANVESNDASSMSDWDVPSVAEHEQNEHRTGFLPIVRVIAELWLRLAKKSRDSALSFVKQWQSAPFRMTRRLALFAATDEIVPPDWVADLLLSIPAREIFLASSSVEVYRLVELRWKDLSGAQWQAIEKRIEEGPPPEVFREDRELSVDRCRFDFLGHLERIGIKLRSSGKSTLDRIRSVWPNWELRPEKYAGFHFWHESTSGVVGDPSKLKGISDSQLVPEAKRLAEEDAFFGNDDWRALCHEDPERAFRGLIAQADKGEWPVWAWRAFFWAAPKEASGDAVSVVAGRLLQAPSEAFAELATHVSWWLNEIAARLDDVVLLSVWDRVMDVVSVESEELTVNDFLTAALNHPAGRLVEVLLKRNSMAGSAGEELSNDVRIRLDRLVSSQGNFGRLARVRLAAEVSVLFERAPEWTKENLTPLFDLSEPDALAMWSARRYSNYIGSPELFRLTKEPFIGLFGKVGVAEEVLETFSVWLTAIAIANQSGQAQYPFSFAEMRSAIRTAGAKVLPSVARRISAEMRSAAPQDKASIWERVVGPVFKAVWPLDLELQTPTATFELVRILCATGVAFEQAADVIVPFIRPEEPRHHISVRQIAKADEEVYWSSPVRVLDLLDAVVGDSPAPTVFGLKEALNRVQEHAGELANSRRFQKLLKFADAR